MSGIIIHSLHVTRNPIARYVPRDFAWEDDSDSSEAYFLGNEELELRRRKDLKVHLFDKRLGECLLSLLLSSYTQRHIFFLPLHVYQFSPTRSQHFLTSLTSLCLSNFPLVLL